MNLLTLFAVLALLTTAAYADPLPVPKPPDLGGSYPHGPAQLARVRRLS